jgi:LCP family protein required for cell wall assembly
VFRMHGGTVIASKVGYAVSCIVAAVVLVVGGYAHFVQGKVTGFESGVSLGTGGPQTGAMNILLMGLESRTDYEGNILSAGLLAAMHAGSVQGVQNGVGGQDTNTLILIHVFAGGQRAVGFSIPRDDWVTYPKAYDGQTQGKVDQAYGLAYAQSLSQTVSSTMSRNQRYLLANEAGQAAAVATVEAVTGQHIDHFAEVNLAGFYQLAWVFGGIEACLKSWNGGQNLHDANSGFNQKHAGYVFLWPAQALAFVRERDNLPNGDLDRTHRQQAVIDYVIWKLSHEGVFSDLGQLTSLLNVASKYVIVDKGWNVPLFAGEMHALTGRHLSFYTAPIVGYQTIDGQAANVIDVPAVQADIKKAFTAAPPASSGKKKSASGSKSGKKPASIPPPSTVTVDVYNGGSTPLLASHVSQAFVSAGYKAGTVGNPSAQSYTVKAATQVFYGAGTAANAAKIARYFGVTPTASTSLAAGHVEVLLGTSSTAVPAGLTSASGATSGTTPSPSSTPTSSPSTSAANNGAAGGAVTVRQNAPYGIPCVY